MLHLIKIMRVLKLLYANELKTIFHLEFTREILIVLFMLDIFQWRGFF